MSAYEVFVSWNRFSLASLAVRMSSSDTCRTPMFDVGGIDRVYMRLMDGGGQIENTNTCSYTYIWANGLLRPIFSRNKDSQPHRHFHILGKILKNFGKTANLGCLSPTIDGDRRRWASAFARYSLTLICHSRDTLEQPDAPTILHFHYFYQERLSLLQSERARDVQNFPCQEAPPISKMKRDSSQLRKEEASRRIYRSLFTL